ncbi:DUF3108 domain-containing protein [Lacinutrix jangbogonensis]|uniref:DUF3108 domain-containing protein n=1 Tax=Lacinutrix jangbogonensis TaxID=1469557 RepID=UPI00053D52EA|nr:hypothetical protein [Lacinutrix jangbogonensis]
MKILKSIVLITLCFSMQVFSQEVPLSPENNTTNKSFVKNESSVMTWFMLKDSHKIEIGKVSTQIQKKKENIYIITKINMKQSNSQWIDSTIVETKNFKPIYHSSYNQQRNMALSFGKEVTGYYLYKKTGTKKLISEKTAKPYFDSNFYPQLIRWLPLKDGYSTIISIFDYNPNAKVGVINATIKNTTKTSLIFKEKERHVWKVEVTDDISDNSATSTYYIDTTSRKILKQDIEFNGRKMSMEIIELHK